MLVGSRTYGLLLGKLKSVARIVPQRFPRCSNGAACGSAKMRGSCCVCEVPAALRELDVNDRGGSNRFPCLPHNCCRCNRCNRRRAGGHRAARGKCIHTYAVVAGARRGRVARYSSEGGWTGSRVTFRAHELWGTFARQLSFSGY